MGVSAERIKVMAAAARVPIGADAPERIAQAISVAVTKFTSEPPQMAFETEPSTFVAVATHDRPEA